MIVRNAPEGVDMERAQAGLCGAPCDPPCERRMYMRGLCLQHYRNMLVDAGSMHRPLNRCGSRLTATDEGMVYRAHGSMDLEAFLAGAPVVDVGRAMVRLCGAPCDPPCDRAATNRGLCKAHYDRWYAGSPIDTPIGTWGGNHSKVRHPDTCAHPGCAEPYFALGYCRRHYDRKRAGTDMDKPFAPSAPRPCSVCGKPSVCAGMCMFHYNRSRRGVPLDMPKLSPAAIARLKKMRLTAREARDRGLLDSVIADAGNSNDGEKNGQAYHHRQALRDRGGHDRRGQDDAVQGAGAEV